MQLPEIARGLAFDSAAQFLSDSGRVEPRKCEVRSKRALFGREAECRDLFINRMCERGEIF